MSDMIGHNGGPSFDELVQETLRTGLLITIKDALICAIRDDRLEYRHRRVLAEVVECLNHSSGMAYPGRKKLAEMTGYTELSVAQAIKDLTAFGYLTSRQQAAEGGGRAVAHYAIMHPSREELQAEITTWTRGLRDGRYGSRLPRDAARVNPVLHTSMNGVGVNPVLHTTPPSVNPVPHTSPPSVNPVLHTGMNGVGVNPVLHARKAGVNPVVEAGVNPLTATVTSRELEDRKNNKPSAYSVAAAREDADGSSNDAYETVSKRNGATATNSKRGARSAEDDFDVSVEVTTFIGRHVNVEPDTATRMLRSNISIYGREVFLEAYAITVAEMATGLVATPYKYLLKVAEGKKREREARATERIDGRARPGQPKKPDWHAALERTMGDKP